MPTAVLFAHKPYIKFKPKTINQNALKLNQQASQAQEGASKVTHQEDRPSSASTASSTAPQPDVNIQEYDDNNDPFDNSLSADCLRSVVTDLSGFPSEASCSVACSAAEQVKKDLDEKNKLLQEAKRKAQEFESRCKALQSQLEMSNQKRKASETIPSTQPEAEASPSPSKKPRPFNDILAGEGTDDDVPTPDEASSEPTPTKENREYQKLNSVLCAYKTKQITPSHDGNVTFEIVAEMCLEDAKIAAEWKGDKLVRMHPVILSALRVVYKDKQESWYEKPFLKSPRGTRDYWIRVLKRRAQIWNAEANKHKRRESMQTVTERLRKKIAQRTKRKVKTLTRDKLSPGHASTPILLDSSSSDSDSDSHEASPVPTGKKEVKLAPGPDSYSKMEIKRFAKLAKQIRDVDESKGHSAAIACFLDEEFSENSGTMAEARRQSVGSWKHERFNSACSKAAKIMEDRPVALYLIALTLTS